MTIEELRSRLRDHIEHGDDRLIRMLYALVYVYESDEVDGKPTAHSYDIPESDNNDV
jgi:hypothetical protein